MTRLLPRFGVSRVASDWQSALSAIRHFLGFGNNTSITSRRRVPCASSRAARHPPKTDPTFRLCRRGTCGAALNRCRDDGVVGTATCGGDRPSPRHGQETASAGVAGRPIGCAPVPRDGPDRFGSARGGLRLSAPVDVGVACGVVRVVRKLADHGLVGDDGSHIEGLVSGEPANDPGVATTTSQRATACRRTHPSGCAASKTGEICPTACWTIAFLGHVSANAAWALWAKAGNRYSGSLSGFGNARWVLVSCGPGG